MNFIDLNFKNLKPFGIADITASTASDAVPHRPTIAERHLSCSYGNLDNRSTQVLSERFKF